jgi:hypothetical protein
MGLTWQAGGAYFRLTRSLLSAKESFCDRLFERCRPGPKPAGGAQAFKG